MEFIRIGDKLINLRKINETVRRILQLRSEGLSQQEVASKLSLDRGFISGWNPGQCQAWRPDRYCGISC